MPIKPPIPFRTYEYLPRELQDVKYTRGMENKLPAANGASKPTVAWLQCVMTKSATSTRGLQVMMPGYMPGEHSHNRLSSTWKTIWEVVREKDEMIRSPLWTHSLRELIAHRAEEGRYDWYPELQPLPAADVMLMTKVVETSYLMRDGPSSLRERILSNHTEHGVSDRNIQRAMDQGMMDVAQQGEAGGGTTVALSTAMTQVDIGNLSPQDRGHVVAVKSIAGGDIQQPQHWLCMMQHVGLTMARQYYEQTLVTANTRGKKKNKTAGRTRMGSITSAYKRAEAMFAKRTAMGERQRVKEVVTNIQTRTVAEGSDKAERNARRNAKKRAAKKRIRHGEPKPKREEVTDENFWVPKREDSSWVIIGE